jgi:hypothetical protein
MVRSEQYALLAVALGSKGVTLRTQATAYRAAHELPGWSEAFRAHTPASVWREDPGADGLLDALQKLPPGPAFEAWLAEELGVPISLDEVARDVDRELWGLVIGLSQLTSTWGDTPVSTPACG